MLRTVYRAVRRHSPSLGDFWSDYAHGDPPLPQQLKEPLMWAGISTWADRSLAAKKAVTYGQGLFVAELSLDDDKVIVKNTGTDPLHMSVMGPPATLRSMVVRVLPINTLTN